MLLDFPVTDLKKGQSTNATASSFAAADGKPTVTRPAATATRTVIDFADAKSQVGSRQKTTLKVIPYGGNDNNDQIKVKVIGWSRVTPRPQNGVDFYMSRLVVEVLCTLSSSLPGVATQAMVATEFLSDTLSVTNGIAVLHQGTGDIDTAWFECDTAPYELVEIISITGTGGDAANCFYGW